MAPLDPTASASHLATLSREPFRPFHTYKQNPSWLAVEPLGGTTIQQRPRPLDTGGSATDGLDDVQCDNVNARPIHITTELVPVTYKASSAATKRIHSANSPKYDLVVHVGVGLSGAIKLERRARKLGYDKADVDNELAPRNALGQRGFVDSEFERFAQEIRTDVNVDKVVAWCKTHGGVTQIKDSDDAGLYLCEFTLFGSLARSRIRAQHSGASDNSATESSQSTPVQFIHVPPLAPGEPYDVKQLTAAIRLILWAMVNEGGLDRVER
ncbi:hypothetical protein OIV83_003340 [Microbotryomycetes sp. JL201]|nr:hypothetical protein OIV83_003340 [Microbotryomycetes sp. JL201]